MKPDATVSDVSHALQACGARQFGVAELLEQDSLVRNVLID